MKYGILTIEIVNAEEGLSAEQVTREILKWDHDGLSRFFRVTPEVWDTLKNDPYIASRISVVSKANPPTPPALPTAPPPRPPAPEVVDHVLNLIDQSEGEGQSRTDYNEGIRVGIMWATGRITGHPLD